MSPSLRTPNPERLLERLDWTVIRRLDGLLQGDYRTLFRGFGLDLADLREYQYHDDVRYIDWNVTARLSTPYVREYHEDREVTAWFLLDLSPSVDFGSEKVKKQSVSIDFVTVIARLLTRHGNRVGAMFYGERLDSVIPARSGRRHVLHILNRMLTRPTLTQSNATNLEEFLKAAAERREKELRGAFRQAGVDALELCTDDDLVDSILRFADLRKRRSQLSAGATFPAHLAGQRP